MKKLIAALLCSVFVPSLAHARMNNVVLCGDSISRGYGLAQFGDTVSPTHPLYLFRSIPSIANALLEASGSYWRVVYIGSCLGDVNAPARIAAFIADGRLTDTDKFVIEDAGDTSTNPAAYQAEWERLITAAKASGAQVYALTTADYPPAPLNSQFDTSFGGRTMNDAIRAAAANSGASIIDVNAGQDWYRVVLNGQTGTPSWQVDGVHPWFWGQVRYAGLILHGTGLSVYTTKVTWSPPTVTITFDPSSQVKSYAPLSAVVAANWQNLSYGGQFWAPEWAQFDLDYGLFP